MTFFLRWMLRPVVFLVPLSFVGQWSGIEPGWKMAALLMFCLVWAHCVRLFDVPATRLAKVSRGRAACAWPRWDFEQVEAAMAISLTFIGRTIAFALPALAVARWCDAPMGWKTVALIVFSVAWDAGTDRIGKQA